MFLLHSSSPHIRHSYITEQRLYIYIHPFASSHTYIYATPSNVPHLSVTKIENSSQFFLYPLYIGVQIPKLR